MTAVLVAAKFHENSDEQKDVLHRLVVFTAGSCKKPNIIAMEMRMLHALEFRIGSRAPKRWRRRLNTGSIRTIDIE